MGLNYGSFKEIETTLFGNANTAGVRVLQPYAVHSVEGQGEKKGNRYPKIALTCQQWDEKKKQFAFHPFTRVIVADLLVIATGGGAAQDPVVTGTLGFTYEKLKAKNYMAYGIFEPEVDLDGVDQGSDGYLMYKEELSKAAEDISGVGTFTPRQNEYQYFLTSLAGITAKDYRDLQKDQPLLKRLLVALKAGESLSYGIRESLKEVQKNVLAFKIRIQRARQFYSPEFPAVMVGDAAVTPHPDTASGYGSGFRGYEELKVLYQALFNTDAPKDTSAIYQDFNDRYEMHVSEKAIEGTETIITHNLRLLDTFISDLDILKVRTESPHLERCYEIQAKTATRLTIKLEGQQNTAEGIRSRYKANSGGGLQTLNWDETVGKLWKELAMTWKGIKIMTANHSLLVEKVASIEAQTKTREKLKQSYPTKT